MFIKLKMIKFIWFCIDDKFKKEEKFGILRKEWKRKIFERINFNSIKRSL